MLIALDSVFSAASAETDAEEFRIDRGCDAMSLRYQYLNRSRPRFCQIKAVRPLRHGSSESSKVEECQTTRGDISCILVQWRLYLN